jgi:AP-1 complex subunit gamma-1
MAAAGPTKLRDFIRSIRACKTAAEERAVISRESALIRTAFKEDENQFRHRNVAKLLFIHMMGFPTHFAQMECLKLIASNKFAEKRIGYLGLAQLLDENTEVLMLVTNSIKNDMANPGDYIKGLALCALGNIGSQEMCRSLAREVEKLMRDATTSYIRKKATFCAVHIVKKVEDMEEKYLPQVPKILDEKDHGVVLAGCALLKAIVEAVCKIEPGKLPEFRKHVPALIRSLRGLVSSGNMSTPAEYDVSGITDPFLQGKILRLLRILGSGPIEVNESDDITEILTQVATRTDSIKNTGNALLYECALTAMSMQADNGLRVLAINILGRFLTSREKNLRYVALATFLRVTAVDAAAVDKHRTIILECLKDTDVSIRKRALDLIFALVSEENVKSLAKELLHQLVVAEKDFKEQLCGKICIAIAKYAPNRRWQIDTLIKVMCVGGNYMPDEPREAFCTAVAATPELYGYTVIKIYFNMKETISQEALVHVGVWCLGEFGDHLVSGRAVGPENQPIHVSPSDVIDLLISVVRRPPNADKASTTHSLVAAALIKLILRCPSEKERIKKCLQRFESSLDADLQQRSCEFLKLLEPTWDASRAQILDRMPVEKVGGAEDQPVGDTSMIAMKTATLVPTSTGDLLDLSDQGGTVAAAPSPSNVAQPEAVDDLLHQVFAGTESGGASAPSQTSQAPAPTPSTATDVNLLEEVLGAGTSTPAVAAAEPSPAMMDVFEKSGLKVQFAMKRDVEPGSMSIVATFANASSMPITSFLFEVSVPKYMTLVMQPASSQVLAPMSSNVTQSMNVVNTMPGGKPTIMKVRITYEHNGGAVQEMAQVSNFP